MTDEEREREYSPSSCLPDGDYRPFVADYRRRSDAAWASAQDSGATTIIQYGPDETQTVDVVTPTDVDAPPLLVFFHGGYWQELSKLDSRFAAQDCLDRGWAFAAVDYTLAPTADLPTIVAECSSALRATVDTADSLGFDPTRVVVSGSSAGAHLAAMVAANTELAAAAVLVSGVYELEPLIGTSINDALGLDEATARACSPLGLDLAGFPPTLVAYGDDETDEFKRQSQAFADRLQAAGTVTSVIEIPDRNHFDVIVDLATPGTALGDAVSALVDQHLEPDRADL